MKRISMWSGPRNVSTACMYSFHHRGDCQVVDEPFYAYYLATSGASHPGREEILTSQSQSPKRIKEQLMDSESEYPLLFMKNMPHHMVGLDMAFVRDFENFFLIREPRAMIHSYIQKIPNPTMEDLGLDLQYKLFEDLKATGANPAVVDSHDLLSRPKQVLQQLCQQLDIPYREGMHTWPCGAITADGVWAKYWYANVHASSGFRAPKPTQDTSLPDYLEPLATECETYYQHMKQYAWQLKEQ